MRRSCLQHAEGALVQEPATLINRRQVGVGCQVEPLELFFDMLWVSAVVGAETLVQWPGRLLDIA